MLMEALRRLLIGVSSSTHPVCEERLGALKGSLGETNDEVAKLRERVDFLEARVNEFVGVKGYS